MDDRGFWVHCNDSKRNVCSVEEVCKTQAYVLFHTQRTLQDKAGIPEKQLQAQGKLQEWDQGRKGIRRNEPKLAMGESSWINTLQSLKILIQLQLQEEQELKWDVICQGEAEQLGRRHWPGGGRTFPEGEEAFLNIAVDGDPRTSQS
ncbi:hypothetical protein DUI87_30309 [Hirundo rustica rustica]|uniref:Uncharacterized protein n=1 Tax=Hirundo rustica rustica TaxID=333673 RepID=A0A3M0IWL0_HIRRU|nr:hypothetical protein DUI87_30309 [Hirundo rustica rustica]